MDTKDEITPNVFDAMEADYRMALLRRRNTIIRQRSEGMTQQAIADYWHVDIARINRILKNGKSQPQKKVGKGES